MLVNLLCCEPEPPVHKPEADIEERTCLESLSKNPRTLSKRDALESQLLRVDALPKRLSEASQQQSNNLVFSWHAFCAVLAGAGAGRLTPTL